MEPVRGGKLVNLKEDDCAKLKLLRPEESTAAWGFRFLQGLPNVKMILSGMSNMAQLQDNINTFEQRKSLDDQEMQRIFEIAEGLKNTIPCTACRYCVEGCPMGLDIPTYISVLNDLRFAPVTNTAMMLEFTPEDKKPSACIACGKCSRVCPQNIDIPATMQELTETLKKVPSWREVCRQREEEQKKLMK
jgi:predicted aldo/keto reductase-like oxidoreductase